MAILRKFIGNDQVAGEKVLLDNNQALRAKTSAGVSEALLKLDSANVLQLLKLPQVSSDPVAGNDIVRKSYLDTAVSSASSMLGIEIDAVESRLIAEEVRAQAAEALIDGKIEAEKTRALAAEAALDLEIDLERARALAKEAELESSIATKIPLSYIGQANGVAPLGSDGKLASSYLPKLALSEVFVVATNAARDALVPADVQEGDVVKVTADNKTYIYDGSVFVEITADDAVDSVNGQVGNVVLNTSHVMESGDYRYYTPAREQEVRSYAQGLVTTETNERMYQDGLIRQEFAAADQLIISGYQSADAQIRLDYAAADNAVRYEFQQADMAITSAYQAADALIVSGYQTADQGIITAYQAADAQIRLDYAAADASTLAAAKLYTDQEVAEHVTQKLGVANGIATLDMNGKLYTSQLPALAITDVFVVQTLADRNALVVEEGDVAKVVQAQLAGDGVTYLPRSYIYAVDGAGVGTWVELSTESDVDSVAGKVGHVMLDTGDVSEKVGGPLYFTDSRAQTAAVIDSILGGELVKAPSVRAAKTYADGVLVSAKGYTDSELDKLKVQQLQYQEFTADSALVSQPKLVLASEPKGKPWVMRQGILGRPGIDFTMGTDSLANEVTFIGEWANGGLTALEVGDKIHVYYMSDFNPYI